MSVLVIAEHNSKQLKELTYHAISAALQIDEEVHLLITGRDLQSVVIEAEKISALSKIIVVDHPVYEYQLAENTAVVIASISKSYEHIIAASSTFSKNILPRLAALLNVGMISDVIEIISSNIFVRPQFAGNVHVTVESGDSIKVMTIRAPAFPKEQLPQSKSVLLERCQAVIENTQSQFVNQNLTPLDRPDLTSARIILSGGRGLKSAENFRLLETLADRLHAAVGASRAAVDAGFAPNDYQVGQTGKVVAPDLYIAVGISGAIQHLAGMKDSKVVVAINNDPDAPINQMADYVLVGDLFTILPELRAELDKQNINVL